MDIFGKKKIKKLEARIGFLIEDNAFLLKENDKLRNQLAERPTLSIPRKSLASDHTHKPFRPTKDTPDTRRSAHSVHTYETPASKPNDDLMGHVVAASVINTITDSAVSSCYDASSSSSSYSSSSSCDSSSSSSSGGDF